MVVLTVFVLIHDLPIDWLRDRQAFLEQDGNTRVIAVQLLLMIIGIARVAGLFNWLIRVFRLDMTIIGLAGLAVLSTLWSDAPVDTLKQSIILAVTTLYAAYLVLRFDLGEILELMCRMFVISGLVSVIATVMSVIMQYLLKHAELTGQRSGLMAEMAARRDGDAD